MASPESGNEGLGSPSRRKFLVGGAAILAGVAGVSALSLRNKPNAGQSPEAKENRTKINILNAQISFLERLKSDDMRAIHGWVKSDGGEKGFEAFLEQKFRSDIDVNKDVEKEARARLTKWFLDFKEKRKDLVITEFNNFRKAELRRLVKIRGDLSKETSAQPPR